MLKNVNHFACYLPSVVMQQIAQHNKKVKLFISNDYWFGLTFPEDITFVENNITRFHQQGMFGTIVS
jgi:hypothetical protein